MEEILEGSTTSRNQWLINHLFGFVQYLNEHLWKHIELCLSNFYSIYKEYAALSLSLGIFCLNRNQLDARYANFYLSPSENSLVLYLCEDSFGYATLRFVGSRY